MVLTWLVSGILGGLAQLSKFLYKNGVLIILVVGAPLLFIWSLNVLLGMQLPYTFATWFASVIFIGVPLAAIVLVRRFL